VLVEHGEDLVYEQKITGHLTKEREGLSLKIPLEKFKPGIHKGFLSIQTNDMVEQRYFDFVIAERIEKLHFALTDPEEEIQLIKIFGTVRIPTDWKNMNLETKKTVISQAWQTMAANASLQPDDLIFMISDRIDHCNKNFSHFDAGWKTDMGRIYIRNGAPDDIEKDQTGDDTRFVRKDIQIWKYQKQKNAAYVFVDVQMSGNFKLIYVVNDPMENSHPDWQRYLGESFDTDRLKQ
jgi:GWxTD domain-containing protein